MKKKVEHDDQEIDPVHDTVDLEDLQAELQTKLGDGELWEDEGKFYYKPDSDKTLYAVDFDTQDTEKWMQGAVKKPGALSKSLGIPEKENIPMSLINEKIAALRKKAEGDKKLSASDKKLLERLLFAKRAKSISKKKKKDLTTNDEESDSDDPRETRTDSVEGSCPLSKKNKKKSAENMKKVEKKEDMYDKEKEDETVQDEDEEEKTVADTIPEPEVEEDMKKEPTVPQISPEEIKSLVADLVQKEVNLITKDFQEREKRIQAKTIADLIETLQEKPYGYSKERLEGKSLERLQAMKEDFENSQLYKDFMKDQAPSEDMIDINKEVFSPTDDFMTMGDDPWASFKSGTIKKGE